MARPDDLILWTELPDAFLPARPSARYVSGPDDEVAALQLVVPTGGGFVAVGFHVAQAPEPDAKAALIAEVEARRLVSEPELVAVERRLAALDGAFAGAARTQAFVEELAETIRLFALNAILAAHRLADSAAIGAVAGLLQTRSDAAVPDLRAFGGEIERVAAAHARARFALACVPLLAAYPETAEPLAAARAALERHVAAMDAALEGLSAAVATIESHFKTIRFLELQGRIEAARASDTAHVLTLFEEIGRQVRLAGAELQPFAALG